MKIKRKHTALLFLAYFLPPTILPAYASDPANEVLTIEETAAFLMIDKAELESLAQQHQIPARKINTNWRFSKSALIHWLSGKNADTFDLQPLSSIDMSSIQGRGTDSTTAPIQDSPPQEPAPAEQKTPETIGTESNETQAQDIFLRNETITLGKHQFSVEYEQLYSYSDNQGFLSSMDQKTLTSKLGLRYGIMDNLELSSFIPYTFTMDREFYVDGIVKTNKNEWGGIALQLERPLLQENIWIPETILILGGEVPVSNSLYQLNIGTSLVKSFDPAALFTTVFYNYNFEDKDRIGYNTDSVPFIMRDYISASIGYMLSVNSDLSIGTAITGLFPLRSYSGDDLYQQHKETYNMQLRCTTLLTKDLYIDPSVTYGLSSSSSGITFGVSFVYSVK